ncbi:MAG: hydrogenase [Planctomycetota bacterium]
METLELSDSRAREGQRLLRVGVLLFLFALLVGLAVPRFAVPRVGLSTHLLGLMQGTFLLVAGLLWPKLKLTRAVSRAGSYLAIYGCLAAWTANLLGALWGAGNSMFPIAAGQARGNVGQERIIAAGLVTAAVSLIAMAMIILWGLRGSSIGPPVADKS